MTSPLPEGPYHVRLGTQGMSPILKCSESSTVSTCQSEPVTPRDGRHERWATLKDAKKSLEDQLDAVQQALQELHEEKLTEAHKKAEDKATLAESLQDQLEKLTAKLDEDCFTYCPSCRPSQLFVDARLVLSPGYIVHRRPNGTSRQPRLKVSI
eukprot:g2034.t1